MHHPLTSPWRIGSTPDPADAEAHEITLTVALVAAVSRIGATRLLLAQMDWERLFSSANPPGAATPAVAKETLTRQAIRRKELRRKALRSGASGLSAAMRVA